MLARLGLERRSTPAPGPARPAGRRSTADALVNVRNPADGRAHRAGACRDRADYEQRHGLRGRRGAGVARGAGAEARRGRAPRWARNCAATRTTWARWSRSRTARSSPEGLGEVQEMIDIADFAVGQSRMLYGLTMHSERPQPPHVRAVASAGRRRHHLRLQLPGGGVVLERVPRRHLRRCLRVEALAQDPAERASPCSMLCNRVMERERLPPIFQLFIDGGTELADALRRGPRAWRWCPSPARPRSAARSASASPRAWARACSSSAATTPSIVDETANLDLAVPAIVFGAVGTAGQRCTTTRRVLVHQADRRPNSSAAWCTPTARCASATRSRPARSWAR